MMHPLFSESCSSEAHRDSGLQAHAGTVNGAGCKLTMVVMRAGKSTAAPAALCTCLV